MDNEMDPKKLQRYHIENDDEHHPSDRGIYMLAEEVEPALAAKDAEIKGLRDALADLLSIWDNHMEGYSDEIEHARGLLQTLRVEKK